MKENNDNNDIDQNQQDNCYQVPFSLSWDAETISTWAPGLLIDV